MSGWKGDPTELVENLVPIVKIQGPGLKPYCGWHDRILIFVFFKALGQLDVLPDTLHENATVYKIYVS